MTPLPRAFWQQSSLTVAPALLGCILVRRLPDGGVLSGTVVETEAYPAGDPALYAYQSPTPRNAPMFGPAGHVYLYATYRVQRMLNIVCGAPGTAESVLVRALEPLEGKDTLRVNRNGTADDRLLCSGPGRLTAALGLSVGEFNGVDVCGPDAPLFFLPRPQTPEIVTATRIGLSRGPTCRTDFTCAAAGLCRGYNRGHALQSQYQFCRNGVAGAGRGHGG